MLKNRRRYILAVIFALVVIGLYHVVTIRLFSFDLTRQTRNALFVVRSIPRIDETVFLLNIGNLEPKELERKIDSLLMADPKKIGINLCHYKKLPKELIEKYVADNRVIFANCDNLEPGSLSQIIDEGNTVTHFKTDRSDYFELRLTDFKGRGNDIERINYGPRLNYPFDKGELTSSYFWFNPDNIKNRTILLGYMGDYLTDSVYYFQNCRVTPLNRYYGKNHLLPDMYDIEISANIMRTINRKDFINEIDQTFRVLIILSLAILNVIVLTYSKTRWTIVNILIAAVLFIFLMAIASFLIVYLFEKRYFLVLDEVPLILLITTVFTVILNLSEKRVNPEQ